MHHLSHNTRRMMRHYRLLSCLLAWLLLPFAAAGQDISGLWTGTISETVKGRRQYVYFEMQLVVHGTQVSGAAMMARNDSSTATTLIRGTWDGQHFFYREMKLIKLRGGTAADNWCMKACSFSFEQTDSTDRLVGHWTGETALEASCTPGIISVERPRSTPLPKASAGAPAPAPKAMPVRLSITDEFGDPTQADVELLDKTGESGSWQAFRVDGFAALERREGTHEIWISKPGYHQVHVEASASPPETAWHYQLQRLRPGDVFVLRDLHFEQSEAVITPDSELALRRLLLLLEGSPSLRVRIVGHTDNVGNAYLNRVLSLHRARAVAQYLVENGISGARLQTDGLGGDQPLASNDDPEGRYRNRRVEVEVVAP
jgi:outer membrane protein OmpA-like peptidoglycan-associated protein